MTHSRIGQVIKDLARANFDSYKEDYNVDLVSAKSAIETLVEGYYDNRTEDEIVKEKKADFTKTDYIRYISWEWCSWVNKNKDWSKIKDVQELFEWSGQDLENDCSFERDLKSENIFHPSFSLLHEDDQINFNFEIVEENGFNSKIKFIYCESV